MLSPPLIQDMAIIGKTLFNVLRFWGPKNVGRFPACFPETIDCSKTPIFLSELRSSSSEAQKPENGALQLLKGLQLLVGFRPSQ